MGRVARKGQSTVEYALVIAAILAGLLGVQIYLKRGIEGRLHQIGEGFGFVYAPKATTGVSTLRHQQRQVDTFTSEKDPFDPEKRTVIITSEVTADERIQSGQETVKVRPRSKLFVR